MRNNYTHTTGIGALPTICSRQLREKLCLEEYRYEYDPDETMMIFDLMDIPVHSREEAEET